MLQLSTEPKFVYFDIGGVLLNHRRNHIVFAEKFSLDSARVGNAMKTHVLEGCSGRISLEEFWRKLIVSAGGIYDETINYTIEWNAGASVMNQGHQLFAELSQKAPAGLFTNAWETLLDHAFNQGLVPKYEYATILDSSSVGYVKPEPEIYEIAEKACGYCGSDILFVDDTIVNIEAANKRGWQTLLVDFVE